METQEQSQEKCEKKVHPHLLNPDFGYTVASIYAISFFAFTLFLG